MIAAKQRDERGAVAPFVAIMVVILVGMASFAVDLGYQRVAARDMQAVADVVAFDMARGLDGRSSSALVGSTWEARLSDSINRNRDSVGEALTVTSCTASTTALSGNQICATPGVYDRVTKTFTDSNGAPATHVRVITRTKIDYFFPIYANEGWVTKTAYAEAQKKVCIQLGSYAARLKTGNSPLLGPLLGFLDSDLNLGVGDYNALAAVNLELLNLVDVNTAAGTVGELIEGNQLLGLADFYLATATALQQQSGNTAAVGLLQTLALRVPNIKIPLGELLDVGTGGASGLSAALNLLDLVSTAAFVANGDNAVTIPQLNVNLGPLAKVQAKAHITEPLRPACNDGIAKTSQVGVSLDATALDFSFVPLGVLDPLGLTKIETKVALHGEINVGAAEGRITNAKCRPNKSVTVKVSDGLATVNLSLEIKAKFGLLGVIEGPITITGTAPTNGEVTKVIINDGDYDVALPVGNGNIGLPVLHVNTSQLKVLNLPIGALLSWVLNPILDLLINPLLQGLDKFVLSPLLQTLGLQVSGADVFVLREPNCGTPALRG